jgi:hypothetical protein
MYISRYLTLIVALQSMIISLQAMHKEKLYPVLVLVPRALEIAAQEIKRGENKNFLAAFEPGTSQNCVKETMMLLQIDVGTMAKFLRVRKSSKQPQTNLIYHAKL